MIFKLNFNKMHICSSGIVTINHNGQGCCGQEQNVICTATQTTVVEITVDDFLPVELTLRNKNESLTRGGFLISLLDVRPDSNSEFHLQFIVEIKFTAMTKSVAVKCEASGDTAELNVTTDSKCVFSTSLINPCA